MGKPKAFGTSRKTKGIKKIQHSEKNLISQKKIMDCGETSIKIKVIKN